MTSKNISEQMNKYSFVYMILLLQWIVKGFSENKIVHYDKLSCISIYIIYKCDTAAKDDIRKDMQNVNFS